MKFRQATKLHNGDEVLDKRTGKSLMVISKEIHQFQQRPLVLLFVTDLNGRYYDVPHFDIK